MCDLRRNGDGAPRRSCLGRAVAPPPRTAPIALEPAEPGSEFLQSLKTVDPMQAVLVDSIGGFVANHLDLETEAWAQQSERLLSTLLHCPYKCVVVIEETGWGVVPPTQIGGLFRDRLGQLAQQLDQIADVSWLVLQGRAVDLRAISHPVP